MVVKLKMQRLFRGKMMKIWSYKNIVSVRFFPALVLENSLGEEYNTGCLIGSGVPA